MGSGIFIIIFVIIAIVAIVMLVLLLGGSSGGKGKLNANYRNMVSSQRDRLASDTGRAFKKGDPLTSISVERKTSSRLTIKKRLKYAQLPIPPVAFHLFEVGISILAFMLVSIKMNILMQLIALLTGPLFMRWLLNMLIERRFKKFDADYPQFILSLVGLLKTGMNPMGALEAASTGLDEGSLVKQECEMMIERLRFGVPEDKSIGAFGEDIHHPEIELFVQALLLSRKVGGTLSDTLERLAKQVRRRQYFRNSAVSAVGMQRGSIWIIVGMLCLMQIYLYFMYPQIVTAGIQSEMGWEVWQVGIAVILLGVFWVRQVTKIKV